MEISYVQQHGWNIGTGGSYIYTVDISRLKSYFKTHYLWQNIIHIEGFQILIHKGFQISTNQWSHTLLLLCRNRYHLEQRLGGPLLFISPTSVRHQRNPLWFGIPRCGANIQRLLNQESWRRLDHAFPKRKMNEKNFQEQKCS